MNDLISVIIPVYNAEKYLDFCISCFLKQSYSNFELILVNDGSKDGSLNICREYSDRDKRIKVIDRQNGGASAARNSGLIEAQGQYIVFADSDDYVSPSYLKNLYLAAISNNYDIVQCDYQVAKQKTDSNEVDFNINDVKEIDKIQALNDRLYKVTVWGKIYAAHIFEDFKFKEGIIYEDDASYYIFVDRANKLAILNESLYYYYMSDDSVMRNNAKDKSLAFVDIYKERIEYFKARKADRLISGSYDRYCLVLMLFISNSIKYKCNLLDIDFLLAEFKKNYKIIKNDKHVSQKDKLMFSAFNTFPKFFANIISIIMKD